MRAAIAAVAVLWACAGWAGADEPEGELQAAPGSIALELIANVDGEDVFESLPSEQIRIRHMRSGLICWFDPDEANRLLLFPSGLMRGEDVGCDTTNDDRSVTLYATRYPFATSLEEEIDGAARLIERRFADAEDYIAEAEAPAPAGFPQSAHARFAVTLPDGRPGLTRVSVAIVNGWVIKMRFTEAADSAKALHNADADASSVWGLTLSDILTPTL